MAAAKKPSKSSGRKTTAAPRAARKAAPMRAIDLAPVPLGGCHRGGPEHSGHFRTVALKTQPKVKWETSLPENCSGSREFGPSIGNGHVYVSLWNGKLAAFDAKSGERVWATTLVPGKRMDIASTPVVAGNVVCLAAPRGALFAVDAAGGEVLWTYAAKGRYTSSANLADGLVFFSTTSATMHSADTGADWLHAVELQTGALRWTTETYQSVTSSPTVFEELVICNAGRLEAFDRRSGERRWRVEGGGSDAAPAIDAERRLVLARGPGDGIGAFDVATGALRWEARTDEYINSSVAVAEGRAFAFDEKGHLLAVDLDSGRRLWAESFGKVGSNSRSPIIAEGIVYVTVQDSGLHALDAATGRRLWHFEVDTGGCAPVLLDGTLYLVTADDSLLALEA